MGAKRQAKKEFEKEQELEKLRAKAAAAQARKEAYQAKLDSMSPEDRARFFKKRKRNILIVVAVFLLFIVIGAFGGSDSSSSSSGTTKTRNYPASIERISVVNPASVRVIFTVKNDGTVEVKPSCTIKVSDESSTYTGFDIFNFDQALSPGQQKNGAGVITVTKQGAAFVTKGSIVCSAETSDLGSTSGKGVKITSVNSNKAPLSDFDSDANEWYLSLIHI